MATDRTPLLQGVPVRPARQRYPHQTLRRVCTFLLGGVCLVALGVLVFLFVSPSSASDAPRWPWGSILPSSAWPDTDGISYKDLQHVLNSTPNESRVREWSKYYTSGPHLAGKNLSQAEWTRDLWKDLGVEDSNLVSYDVYINYPRGHRLALLESKSHGRHKVLYEASLEEDVLKEDHTSGLKDRIPTFHGYSASGNVTGRFVFCNYGTYQDFEDLQKANISLSGNVALIKYGGIFRGLKVKRAQELGMIGALIYSDPGDDGEFTEEHGYKPYPKGPARNPSSVQRGSVEYLGFVSGDPTTPGYPSKPGVPRRGTEGMLPQIPSLPISYVDALPLLKALNGHGPKSTSVNKHWSTGGLGYKGVKYNIGPSPPELMVNVFNDQEYTITPIWNVIGIINGTTSDEVIVMGNHRDAWIAGGAGDPNSGSAAMNELIRGLGKALKAGWKPLRTIVLASWDGEEYGLLGSTEWVEEYIPWLSESAVAYINVDVGASGPYFGAAAAPLLDGALIDAVNKVQSPNQTTPGQTVGDVWSGRIATMGSGSDFTAFQDFAGIPCIDMGFKFGPESAVYHYHSNYDSFDWMDNFGDTDWHYHVAIAKVWGLLTANLVESPIITFNATNYARAFEYYFDGIMERLKHSKLGGEHISLERLESAIGTLHEESVKFEAGVTILKQQLREIEDLPWYDFWTKSKLYKDTQAVNGKYKMLERKFLYEPGLDKRAWFKHTVFAPGRWTGYAGAVWPGLQESIDEDDAGNFNRWQGIIADQMELVAKLLKNR